MTRTNTSGLTDWEMIPDTLFNFVYGAYVIDAVYVP